MSLPLSHDNTGLPLQREGFVDSSLANPNLLSSWYWYQYYLFDEKGRIGFSVLLLLKTGMGRFLSLLSFPILCYLELKMIVQVHPFTLPYAGNK
jgi:hypothetical protein